MNQIVTSVLLRVFYNCHSSIENVMIRYIIIIYLYSLFYQYYVYITCFETTVTNIEISASFYKIYCENISIVLTYN